MVKGAETTMTALAFVCFDGIGSSVGGWSAGQLYKSGIYLYLYLSTYPRHDSHLVVQFEFSDNGWCRQAVGGWSAGQLCKSGFNLSLYLSLYLSIYPSLYLSPCLSLSLGLSLYVY